MRQKREDSQRPYVPEKWEALDSPVDHAGLERALARLQPHQRGALADAEAALAALEELFHLARRLDLGDWSVRDRLVGVMRCAIEVSRPPDRPRAFSIKSIRGGGIELPFPMPGLRFPCLVRPEIFGPLTRAIIGLAYEPGKKASAAFNDALWAGLWAAFDLHRRLEPLALLHRASLALEEGRSDAAAFRRTAAIAARGCPGSAGRGASEGLVPLAGNLPFPGLPGAGVWFDHCRAMGWAETERVVRCYCNEFYHIDEIRNCTPGREPEAVACAGECIEIRGHGFGDQREWTGYGRASQVLFQGQEGTRVAATDFLPLPAVGDELPAEPSGWSGTRIRVAVPDGAVRGDVSLRVLCRTGPGGRPIDPADCRFPTRLRSGTSHSFLELLGPASAELSVEHGGVSIRVGDERPRSLTLEACARVLLEVTATNAETVVLRDGSGAEIPLVSASPVPTTMRTSVPLDDRAARTFTLTVDSRCLGEPLTRILTLERAFEVNLIPDEQTLMSGGTGSLLARVSCPLPDGGTVRASVDDPWVGARLGSELERDLEIPPGSDRSGSVPLTTQGDLCGTAFLRGELISGSDEEHALGRARVHVNAIPLDLAVTVDVTVGLVEPIAETSRAHAEGAATLTARFPASRSEFSFMLPSTLSIGPINVQPTARRIVATYDPVFGHFDFDLSARVGTDVPGVAGSTLTLNLSSRTSVGERYGSGFPEGRCLGCETISLMGTSFFVGRAVGETTLMGGTYGGRRIAVALWFRMPARPPRRCGQEPPSAGG